MPPLLQGKTYVLLEVTVRAGDQVRVDACELPDLIGEQISDETVSGDWLLGLGWSPVTAAACAVEEMLR